MKRLHKPLAVILICMMVVGFVGCGDNAQVKDNSETKKEETTSEVTPETKSETGFETTSSVENDSKTPEKEKNAKSESKTDTKKSTDSVKPSSGTGLVKKQDSNNSMTTNKNGSSSNKTPANSGLSVGNNSKPSEKPNSGSGTPTTKPGTPTPTPTHKHSYTSKITTKATCTANGTKTYTCSCGDSYTESIPKSSHNWMAQTTTEHHDAEGYYDTVIVQEAWDEPIYEARYVCNQCGFSTCSGTEIAEHLVDGDCENYSTRDVQVGTKHHNAVTEQKWVETKAAYDETITIGYKCSVCGAMK